MNCKYISVMLILSVALANKALWIVSAYPNFDSPAQCTEKLICDAGECCLIGMARYTTPSCAKLQQEGDMCRPINNDPFNGTFTAPDGTIMAVSYNTYTRLCPCDPRAGLTCSRFNGLCEKSISEN